MDRFLVLLDLNFEVRRSLFIVVQGVVPAVYLMVFTFLDIENPISGTEIFVENIVFISSATLISTAFLVAIILIRTHRQISIVGSAVYFSLGRGSNVVGDVRWSGVSIMFYALTVLTFHFGIFGIMQLLGAHLWEYFTIAVIDIGLMIGLVKYFQEKFKHKTVESVYPDIETQQQEKICEQDTVKHASLSLRNTARDIYVVMLLAVAIYVATMGAIAKLSSMTCLAGTSPSGCEDEIRTWLILVSGYGMFVTGLSALMLLRLRLAFEEFTYFMAVEDASLSRMYWTRRVHDRTFLLAVIILIMFVQLGYLFISIVWVPLLAVILCVAFCLVYISYYIKRTRAAFDQEVEK